VTLVESIDHRRSERRLATRTSAERVRRTPPEIRGPCGRCRHLAVQDVAGPDDQLSDLQRRHLLPTKTQLNFAHLRGLAERQTERLVVVRVDHHPRPDCVIPVFLQHNRVHEPSGMQVPVSHFESHRNRPGLPDDRAVLAM
jgi:hypothetical protein